MHIIILQIFVGTEPPGPQRDNYHIAAMCFPSSTSGEQKPDEEAGDQLPESDEEKDEEPDLAASKLY